MNEKEIEQKLEEYRGLIVTTAKRYHLDGMTWEDNFQELCLVFVRALNNFEAHRNAELKTLFIKYAKGWAGNVLRNQNYQKRGKLIVYSEANQEDGLDKLWIDSLQDTSLQPDEIEFKERMVEDIAWFIKNDRNGYLIQELDGNGLTLREISNRENISTQAVSQRHMATIKRLKTHLKIKGYELE